LVDFSMDSIWSMPPSPYGKFDHVTSEAQICLSS
jgi:hypothetical protein